MIRGRFNLGWKGIPFWKESDQGRIQKAIAFTENITIDANYFTPSSEYKILKFNGYKMEQKKIGDKTVEVQIEDFEKIN